MRHIYFGFCGILFCLWACTAELPYRDELTARDLEVQDSIEYDNAVIYIAKAVRSALANNTQARELVHSMALEMKDGDYDILLGDIIPRKVEVSDPMLFTKGCERISFGTLLNAYFDAPEIITKSTSESIIQELQESYPLMQISVPVHADEWNPDTYMPVVCYLPYDYDESSSEYVPGFDVNGNYVELDSYVEPDQPVIVISRNERGGDSPRLVVVSAPTNLDTLVTETSIVLTWHWVSGANGYKIWRKGPSESVFSQVGLSYGIYNSSFEDVNISTLSYYQYYVTAYSEVTDSTGFTIQYESEPSSVVNVRAPGRPPRPDNLSLTMVTSSKALLMWQNNPQTNSIVKVDYMVPGAVNQFTSHGILSNGESDYIANLPYTGRRHVFKVYRSNLMGNSDPQYDFCYRPYRDINSNSSVYVKKLSYTGNIENWAQGVPEFKLKVYYCNENITTNVQEVDLTFSSAKKKEQSFSGKLAYTWSVTNYLKDWYSSLYLYL